MGTSHELGQNFAKAFDIQYLDAERARSSTCWTDVVGLVHPHGRRADHVPRRRRRPARPAAPRPDPGGGAGGPRRGRRRADAAARLAASCGPPGCASQLDDARPTPSFGRRVDRLGAEGRAGAGRGRAAGPRERRGDAWRGATRRAKDAVPVAAWPRPGAGTARARSRASCSPRHSPPRSAHGRRSTRSRRRSRRPPTGSPACPGPRSATEGEDRMRRGRRHRALPAPRADGIAAARGRRRRACSRVRRPGLLRLPPVWTSSRFAVSPMQCRLEEAWAAAHAFSFRRRSVRQTLC